MTTERPNVLLVVLDTARASAFDGYGNGSPTPGFRRVADEGTIFGHAVAPSPWTLPSHVSLFSGLMPSEHGVMGDAWAAGELPTVGGVIARSGDRWLPRAAKRAEYQTFGAVANLWVGPRIGFHDAFDRFVTRRGDVPDAPEAAAGAGMAPGTRRRRRLPAPVRRLRLRAKAQLRLRRGDRDGGARRLVGDFESWFQGRDRSHPFFAFFNFLEPHAPYVPPREFQHLAGGERLRAGRLTARLQHSPDLMLPFNLGLTDLSDRDVDILRRLYEGEVGYVDQAVGRILERLEEDGELDRTVVAVTADHGENVGEHHLLAHNMSLHETVLHVPLALRGPGVPQGRHVETVSLVALHPTLLGVIAGRPEAGSLFSEAGNGARSEYESAQHQVRALAPLLAAGGANRGRVPPLAVRKGVAAYRGAHKAVAVGGRVEVFDLARDPAEGNPLVPPWPPGARAAADEAAAAADALEGRSAGSGPKAELDDEIRDHLEALGYL
jgi:arylsulfatase A-like enzyme